MRPRRGQGDRWPLAGGVLSFCLFSHPPRCDLPSSPSALYFPRARDRSPPVPPSSLPSRRTERHDRTYRPRILAALALSLGVLVLAFRFWPVEERTPPRPYVAEPRERVPLELIEPTRQTPRAAPPPPPTLPPVEVPDDVPIPEEELEFEVLETAPTADIALPEAPPGPEMEGRDEAPPTFVARADRRPQTVSPVLPTYPAEAERRGIRARVRVRLRIDERGRLKEVEITDRFLIDDDREERVDEIGYGVEQAVLDAVNRTRFRPGRHEGRPVETYTTMTLGVGV